MKFLENMRENRVINYRYNYSIHLVVFKFQDMVALMGNLPEGGKIDAKTALPKSKNVFSI
jgi:hypothetical protein